MIKNVCITLCISKDTLARKMFRTTNYADFLVSRDIFSATDFQQILQLVYITFWKLLLIHT